MKFCPLIPALAFLLLSSCSISETAYKHDFLQCLSDHSLHSYSIFNIVYTPTNSSYSSVLNFSIQNLRFSTTNTPKPLAIITPLQVSHIQAAVICSKKNSLQIRIRSGGHDYEGLSYLSSLPFIVIDLINLTTISIDHKSNTAWVQSGATVGELYYKIFKTSPTLAFPAGVCPTVGVGGLFSGGGSGTLQRKYGLAADNVIDAYLVDANGKFHDRESMGEDLFWAIRGGGGGSFGIVVAWKVKLVRVPRIVTSCLLNVTLEEDAVKLIHRWQYVANKVDENLFLAIVLTGGTQGDKTNPTALFTSLFLGKANELMAILNTTFPELSLTKKDCIESSWINSTLTIAGFPPGEALETLLNRKSPTTKSTKVKSDYVKEPISEAAIKGLWKRLKARDIEVIKLLFIPYGGRMSQIFESETPYSHRAGYLYRIGYKIKWQEDSIDAEKRHVNWMRKLYDYMTPFVSKLPRASYSNYRDLDLGTNNKYGATSYKQASVWGLNYFGNNFDRLVHVKTKVDPYNFFMHEQSIPILSSNTKCGKELDFDF